MSTAGGVPKGYKRTEVGVIPEEWEVGSFESLADIQRGKFSARPRNDPRYYGGDIPFIQTGDVSNSTGRVESFSQTLNARGLKVSRQFPAETIFFTIAANIGDVGICSFAAACPDSLVAVNPKGETSKSWLAYELRSRKSQFEGIASHNAQMNINLEKLRPFLLPVPPPTEQRAIAAALGDVDALLAALDAQIAKQRDLKQATMQQLLTGQTRLPGFTGKWETKSIGEFTECTAGGTPNTLVAGYWGGNIHWMSSGELHRKMVSEVDGRITEEGLQNSSAKLLPPNCILIGLAGQGRTRGTVAMNLVPTATNQSIAAIFPAPSYVSRYLYHNLDFRYDELRDLSAGDGGRGGLNLTNIRSIIVPFPILEEQAAIAETLSEMDAAFVSLESRRAKTAALKQSMMQALLTGRIRLVEPAARQAAEVPA